MTSRKKKSASKTASETASETAETALIALRDRKTSEEVLLKENLSLLAEAAASASLDDVSALSKEIAEIRERISAISKEIAETGFADIIERIVRDALDEIPIEERPAGRVQFAVVFDDGELIAVRPVIKIESKSGRKAALTASKKARDPRLPPAGTVLESRSIRGIGPCKVRFTDSGSVIVYGPTHDGSVLDGETFKSVSAAGTRVTGRPTNGYEWMRLGPPGHSWSGEQV